MLPIDHRFHSEGHPVAMKFNKTSERSDKYIRLYNRASIFMLIARELIEFALLRAIMRCRRASMHNTSEIMRNLFNYDAINANIEALCPHACECQ